MLLWILVHYCLYLLLYRGIPIKPPSDTLHSATHIRTDLKGVGVLEFSCGQPRFLVTINFIGGVSTEKHFIDHTSLVENHLYLIPAIYSYTKYFPTTGQN